MLDAPWLRIAKSLPVGGQQRFRCCGRDNAAVVFNNPASWSGYCHRCHEPMFERKQYAEVPTIVHEPSVTAKPADVIKINDASQYEQELAYKFLISKGLMPDMVPNLCYSPAARRLVFPLSSTLSLGRAMTDWNQPKWIQFGGQSAFALTTPRQQDVQGIVLTEDYLSALKVQYALNHFGDGNLVCAALLGTRLDRQLKLTIAQDNLPVLLMLDGDAAGYAGIERIRKDLRIYTDVQSFTVDGKDPKDLLMGEILDAIKQFGVSGTAGDI